MSFMTLYNTIESIVRKKQYSKLMETTLVARHKLYFEIFVQNWYFYYLWEFIYLLDIYTICVNLYTC